MGDIQKTNGDEQRSDDQGRNSHLRLSNPIAFRPIVGVDLIRESYTNHCSGDESDTKSEISKARSSNTETVSTGEEFW